MSYNKLTLIQYKEIFIFSVHCKWSSWGRWSECSKSCGGGSQEKRRTEATTAKYGGRECRGRNNRTRSCKTQHCPGKII